MLDVGALVWSDTMTKREARVTERREERERERERVVVISKENTVPITQCRDVVVLFPINSEKRLYGYLIWTEIKMTGGSFHVSFIFRQCQ